jgi:hypothetical protein
MSTTQKPIFNCHAHIFRGIHVPPYLAKSLVWPPLYYLVHLPTLLWIFRNYLRIQRRQKYGPNSIYNRTVRFIEQLKKNVFTGFLLYLVLFWLSLNATFFIIGWLSYLSPPPEDVSKYIDLFRSWLVNFHILLDKPHWLLATAITLFVLSFVKLARNLIYFVLKNIWKFLGSVPGKNTKELLGRYVLLGRFTLYKSQSSVFTKLHSQYPPESKFIILPMDMEFLEAGKVSSEGSYKEQMLELVKMKSATQGKNFEPFVFVDPRRIRKDGEFLKYIIEPGNVQLDQSCDVYNYIEINKFAGFKIYPALGYYPFDEDLLPLWLYASQNQLPIMTHCIKGTIFYRGGKKEEWNIHPVFMESDGKGKVRPLSLPEKKNVDFTVNFTHPLNYLCLLNEPLLRELVSNARKDEIRTLFGYTDKTTPLKYNLSNLKICLAHFGGDDQWNKYLESDRYPLSQRIIRNRNLGIDFALDKDGSLRWGLFEQLWKFGDWYSIICSLMVQYPQVYADISYILCKPRIMPLLKETLNKNLNPYLRTRVLFGTDFYVVRNHKSDKDLLAQLTYGLTEDEFDLIARENPESYLGKN